MNTALIMLGSNLDSEINLEIVKEKIAEHFEIVSCSSRTKTKPYGKQYKSDFYNEALKILSVETAEETKRIFKDIEVEMGRTVESKKHGQIPIDIDLIFWNENLVHSDYDRFLFVKASIDEITD